MQEPLTQKKTNSQNKIHFDQELKIKPIFGRIHYTYYLISITYGNTRL